MDKRTKMLLIAGVLVIGGYLAWRWWENRSASSGGGGQEGSNLNSVAPELVGGSTGPSIGPAVSTPITITINETSPDSGASAVPQLGANTPIPSPLVSQSQAAAAAPGAMPAGSTSPMATGPAAKALATGGTGSAATSPVETRKGTTTVHAPVKSSAAHDATAAVHPRATPNKAHKSMGSARKNKAA